MGRDKQFKNVSFGLLLELRCLLVVLFRRLENDGEVTGFVAFVTTSVGCWAELPVMVFVASAVLATSCWTCYCLVLLLDLVLLVRGSRTDGFD